VVLFCATDADSHTQDVEGIKKKTLITSMTSDPLSLNHVKTFLIMHFF